MKKLLALLLALTLALALAACNTKTPEPTEPEEPSEPTVEEPAGPSDLDYVKENGKLVIGYTVYEPMNYTDAENNFTGFDTELATLVCEKLGVTPDFVEINWDTKELELESKSIDCIWNGLTITPDREKAMAITKPYVKNSQVLIVGPGFDYSGTADLIGKTIVAEKNSAGEDAILDNADLAQADFIGKPVQTDCLIEIKAGTADAAVLDMTLANAMIGPGTDYADLRIVDYLAVENYGVGFRKGSDIRDAVNAIFDELIADGTLAALAEKYNLELAD